jgi:hypothetical protein
LASRSLPSFVVVEKCQKNMMNVHNVREQTNGRLRDTSYRGKKNPRAAATAAAAAPQQQQGRRHRPE